MKQLLFLFLTMMLFGIAQAASIKPIANGSWQDNNIWPGNQLPGASDDVIIPAGFLIDLEGTIEVKSITVNGVFRAKNTVSIDLKVEWILVSGNNALFEVGTESQPYNVASGCLITLVGSDDGENHGMGDKYIGAMMGGRIELHGKEKISWTHLGADANVSDSQITMSDPVDWEVGDEIVIVSSRTNWNEAEKHTITAVSGDGLEVSLSSPINYPHVSAIETYTRNKDGKTWTADLRAEVGLLTRNVTVQGDAQSENNGFGGHIMAMKNSTINASNIELYRMGQKAKKARYPWHWHLLHEFGKGQYLKNSSVHRSFNRAITIHGTSYVNVENNFFYDHIGHGVFLEDGTERYNTIKNNVVLLTKRPSKGEQLTLSENQFNEVQNRTPSSYWITNPNNYFEGNVAAGTHGTGYWFALPISPMGDSSGDSRFDGIEAYKEPLGLFKNNKAHSCMSGFDIFDQLKSDHSIRKNAGWLNDEPHLMEDCTWYANELALYSGIGGVGAGGTSYVTNLIFSNNIIVDNKVAIMFASYSQVQESVIVANSGNGIHSGLTQLYRTYDGAGQVHDCHLVGWNETGTDYIQDGGAATKHTNHRISGITTDDGIPPAVKLRDYDIPISNTNFTPQSLSHPRVWNIILYDEDGSFSGRPESSIVANHPMLLVGDEYHHSNWVNAYRSPHKFALIILRSDGTPRTESPNVTCTRTKTDTPTVSYYDMYGYKDHIMTPVIVKENFRYTYTFETLPYSKNLSVILDDATVGDDCILKFTDFGKLGALSLKQSGSPLTSKSSLSDLENSVSTAYYKETNGDLYLKYVATKFRQDLDIDWMTSIVLPMLDTDENGISDRDEIIAGTDPFSDVDIVHDNPLVWDFDNNDQGWSGTPGNMDVSWNSSGYLDCEPFGKDPKVTNVNLQPFQTDKINYLQVRVKNGTSNNLGQLIAFTASSGNIPITFRMETNASEFETILVDLSTLSKWTNNLTVNRLRLDPNANGAAGTISFDHIYLKETATSLSSSDQLLSEVKTIIHPNPVRKGQDVNIRLSNINNQQYGHVVVYDLQGRSVVSKSLELTESIRLSTDHLTKGLYIVHLSIGESSEIFKLIVD